MKDITRHFVVLTGALVVAVSHFAALPLEAQPAFRWNTVASVGIVDESSASLVKFDGGTVAFRPTAPVGSVAVIRYPLSALPDSNFFFNVATGFYESWLYNRLRLDLRFQKNDENGAYVAAAVKRARLADGQVSTLVGVNSLAYFPGPAVQSDERTIGCSSGCFNRLEYSYFVEVVMWKPKATSDPKAVAVSVWLSDHH